MSVFGVRTKGNIIRIVSTSHVSDAFQALPEIVLVFTSSTLGCRILPKEMKETTLDDKLF